MLKDASTWATLQWTTAMKGAMRVSDNQRSLSTQKGHVQQGAGKRWEAKIRRIN